MTVQTTNTTVQFQGDGTAVSFPFGFQVLEPGHIDVFFVNTNTSSSVQGIAAGEVKKLDPANFSVTVNQNAPGGTVKLTGVSAPPADIEVSIERNTPETQLTNYVPNDPFPAETHERALDKLTLLVQELEDEFKDGGFISVPPGEDTDCPPLPIAQERAGKLLGFDSAGCPTTVDFSGVDVVAPQLFSDLSNVDVSNATDRQVASFDSGSGEWTPDNNVFSLNDQSGDLTITTNPDGDIVIESGGGSGSGGSTTTVVPNEDLGGTGLLKKFTAAENGVRGDFLAIRSNQEVEKLAETQSTGSQITASDLTSEDELPIASEYVSSEKTHAVLYVNTNDTTVYYMRLFTLDANNQVVDTVGSEQQIISFSNDVADDVTAMVFDSVNNRFVVLFADPDNNGDIGGIVIEPDFANLSVTTGSKQTTSLSQSFNIKSGAGYDPNEAAILFTFSDGGSNSMALVGVTVDPNNNTLTFGNKVIDPVGGTNGRSAKQLPFSPANNVIGVAYNADANSEKIRILLVNLNGTTVNFGSSKLLNMIGLSFTIVWDETNQFFVVTGEDDGKTSGSLVQASGTTPTVVDTTVLDPDNVLLDTTTPNTVDIDQDNATWMIGRTSGKTARQGKGSPTLLVGSVDPDVPQVVLLPGGAGPNGNLTQIGPTGDSNTNVSETVQYDPDFGAAVLLYRAESSLSDALRISIGEPPALSTNRNQWIGTATEDFTAGDDVTVALRGSEVFVNTNASFQPGERLFLNRQGQLENTGTFTAGIATKANERLLTAAVAGGDTGAGGSSGSSTASSVDEELLSTQNITSTVSEIIVDLPSGYIRHIVEIMEFQAELGSPGSINIRLSPDGGNTFVSSNDYSNGFYNLDTEGSEARMSEANNISRFEADPPPQTGSGIAQQFRMEVFSADSTLFTNTFAMQQENNTQGAIWRNHSGLLAKNEKHNQMKITLDGGGIARGFVRVKGLVK